MVQSLVTQAGIAVILLGLAWFSRGDPRSVWLYVATLVIPVGWSVVLWSALQREETARGAGSWNKEMAQRERKRSMGMLGALFLGWFILAALIVLAF